VVDEVNVTGLEAAVVASTAQYLLTSIVTLYLVSPEVCDLASDPMTPLLSSHHRLGEVDAVIQGYQQIIGYFLLQG